MRSDNNQLDAFRDSPATKAAQWRLAAETCAQQFPGDTERLRYYQEHAEKFEREVQRNVSGCKSSTGYVPYEKGSPYAGSSCAPPITPLPPCLQSVASAIERAPVSEMPKLHCLIHVALHGFYVRACLDAKAAPSGVSVKESVGNGAVEVIHGRHLPTHTFYRVEQCAFREFVGGNRIERGGQVDQFLIEPACADRQPLQRDEIGYQVHPFGRLEHQGNDGIEPVLLFPSGGQVGEPRGRNDADARKERLRPRSPNLRFEARSIEEPSAIQRVGHVDPSGWMPASCGRASPEASIGWTA